MNKTANGILIVNIRSTEVTDRNRTIEAILDGNVCISQHDEWVRKAGDDYVFVAHSIIRLGCDKLDHIKVIINDMTCTEDGAQHDFNASRADECVRSLVVIAKKYNVKVELWIREACQNHPNHQLFALITRNGKVLWKK